MTEQDTFRGRVLGDRYELVDQLGFGGMAEVFRARDLRLGRDVAVKVLRADLARDPSFQSRFRREAQAAASLSHPAVVAVFDTGEDGGVPYIVMELVEGRTLRDILQTEGKLPPERAVEVVAYVCEALEYSHQAGIVHRDIKPGNVMVTTTGEVKVMDFGIARAVTASQSTMTQTAAVMGTAQYLSPEQARGEHVDARSDIYSTGCLLYELLCGRPPFLGDSPVAVAYQHVREDAAPPSRHAATIGPDLDAIVLMAIAKNPAHRYQTAAEMRDDLDRVRRGEPVLAAPVLVDETTTFAPTPAAPVVATTRLRTPEDRARRRRRAYIWLAVGAVALAALAALLTNALLGDSGKRVDTPNVIGLPLAQAIETLRLANLEAGKITRVYSEEPPNEVVDQSPTSDIDSVEGGKVDLTVSQGVEIVSVPDVRGRSLDEAREILADAKLEIGQVVTRDVNRPAGQVLEMAPAPGQRLQAGSRVALAVASGNAPLPEVVGMTFTEAVRILREAGFFIQPQYVPDAEAVPNTVLDQDPGPGLARQGSTVTLTIAESPSPSATPSPSASAQPSPEPSVTFSTEPTPTIPTETTPTPSP